MLQNNSHSASVTVAHPMPTNFAQQVGLALFEAGMLNQFATTLIDRPNSPWLNALNLLTQPFKFDLSKQFSRRAITEFPIDLVQDYPQYEMARLLVGRFDRDKRFTDIVFHWAHHAYDRWVARQIVPHTEAIYGYETACLATFQAAKAQNVACIYDVPSPEHDFVENLLYEEQQCYPELDTPYRRYCRARQTERTQHRRQEWQLADVIVTNSEFTKASYAAAGLDVGKVRVVPLGAPPINPHALDQQPDLNAPLQCLWAGTFGIRKGAHYLLQAWHQLQPGTHGYLKVFGSMGLPAALVQNLPESIQFCGSIPRTELKHHYRKADVLVFPTLCDGFGMVVTEAFAQGLPVITTNQAGAADLVAHGVNGLIVPARDARALAAALDWCMHHRAELQEMRQAALDTAARWQWSDYRRALVKALINDLKN